MNRKIRISREINECWAANMKTKETNDFIMGFYTIDQKLRDYTNLSHQTAKHTQPGPQTINRNMGERRCKEEFTKQFLFFCFFASLSIALEVYVMCGCDVF